MHILSFTNGVEFTFDKSGGPRRTIVPPYQDYVFSNIQRIHGSTQPHLNEQLFRQSYLEARVPAFRVNPLGGKGERLLFYTGSGGYGDQLMAWPVCKLLHKLGYVVDVLVDPGNEPCWQELDFIRKTITLPAPLGDLYEYHHCALYEFVTNADGHPGQMHPTDNILFRMGLEPKTVPHEDKRVATPFTVLEQMSGEAWKDVCLYQLASSNPLRNLSPDATVALLRRLREETKLEWVAIADRYLPKPYYEVCEREKIEYKFFPDIRELMAAAVNAKMAVGPDSFMTHLRGQNLKKGVFYFGTLEPELRLAYYPTVTGIWNKAVCHLSPCHLYTNSFPPWCPTKDTGHCGVISSAPELIFKATIDCLQSS